MDKWGANEWAVVISGLSLAFGVWQFMRPTHIGKTCEDCGAATVVLRRRKSSKTRKLLALALVIYIVGWGSVLATPKKTFNEFLNTTNGAVTCISAIAFIIIYKQALNARLRVLHCTTCDSEHEVVPRKKDAAQS